MVKKRYILELKTVRKSDCPFLYELLLERDTRANISHIKMPSYQNHVKFVMSKPYSKWYVIIHKNEKIGSAYLTKQDEMGLFIKKEKQGHGVGSEALRLLINKNPRRRYLANISPKNAKSIQFFKNYGFKLIQYTYELRSSELA